MMSPSNSDNNSYGTAALSPGSWTVTSPAEPTWNVSSPNSTSSISTSSITRGNAPPNTPSTVSSGSTTTHDFIGLPANLGKPSTAVVPKKAIDIRRQKVAEVKAHKLLNQRVWDPSSSGSERTPASPSCSHPAMDDNGYAIRMEAKRRYKEKKQQEKIAAFVNGGVVSTSVPISSSPPTRVITRPRLEVLATTTRKKKVVAPEEDVENINDYKSIMDIEREKEAERHALYLLKKFGY